MDTPITPPTPPAPSGAAPLPEATEGTVKKYIRTFAGDMEALKKGWMPNLSPLKKTPAAPESAPSPVAVVPPLPASPAASRGTATVLPPVVPVKAPPADPLETYSGDFSQRMQEKQASTATVLAAEQDALPIVPQDAQEKTPLSTILYAVAGAVLLILGIVGAYFAYTRYAVTAQPIVLLPTVSAPIFVDEKEKITATTPKTILQAIEQSATRSLAPNAVRFLYTESATTTDNSVFAALQLPAPGSLLRNMNSLYSMAGIVNAGGSQSPFFILSVSSYSDTFAGMLSWEAKMPRDLAAFFPAYQLPPVSVVATTTIATTTVSTSSPQTATSTPSQPSPVKKVATSTSQAPVIVPGFRDEVVVNHDARVYRDAEGRSILIYGYWNQTTLVIARDPAAFTEILARLATARR